MDVEDTVSYDVLFRVHNFENSEIVLPVVKRCLKKSKDEIEVGRALEIAFCFCLRNFSSNELEEELLKIACPTAKNLVLSKLEDLEKNPELCFEYLAVALKVITYFQGVFHFISEMEKLTFLQVKSLLMATCEMLYGCYSHCKISEEVYGSLFSAASEYLSNFFKNCCSLQEQLLISVNDKLEFDMEDESELVLLNDILNFLSKSGVLLIHLELKTMAKVWKTFASLVERYVSLLKKNYNIGEVISQLCAAILSNVEVSLCKSSEEIYKVVKLSCFLMKLVIKLCEAFKGCLKGCHQSLLSLLLMLCRHNSHIVLNLKENENDGIFNQLTIGFDPLIMQLIADEELVRECHVISRSSEKSLEFTIFLCLILEKLKGSNGALRSLWLNNNTNILQWIFNFSSSDEFVSCYDVRMPDILVSGEKKKLRDLYEYVLVTCSAFSMTASAEEYRLVEKILINNVVQKEPVRAVLAMDMWCFLARFAGSELCLSQIISLGKIFQEFTPETSRPEKWYLSSLIRRLFPLLVERHKGTFLEAFRPSFYSRVWSGWGAIGLTSEETRRIRLSLMSDLDRVVGSNGVESCANEKERKSLTTYEDLGEKIVKLWKFECEILSSSCHVVRLLRLCCVLTACIVTELSSETLFMILSQTKKLLAIGRPIALKLCLVSLLTSLSPLRLPPDPHRNKALPLLAHAFRALLSSPEPLLKQKALDAFSAFSHATAHPEVISLCVHHCPDLKIEVADYFKRKNPRSPGNWPECISRLCRPRFEHLCQTEEEKLMTTSSKKMKMWSPDMHDEVIGWKEDTRRLAQRFHNFSDAQKREIKSVCSFILSLP